MSTNQLSLLDFQKAHNIPHSEISEAMAMQIMLPFSNMEGGLHIIVVRCKAFIGIDMDEQYIPSLMAAQLIYMYAPEHLHRYNNQLRGHDHV